MARLNQDKLVIMKNLRERLNVEIKDERRQLLDRLNNLFREWKPQIPNLRGIFRPHEIDWLLADDINQKGISSYCDYDKMSFVDIVTNYDLYKDEPELDEAGKPLLRRTTALLRIARAGRVDKDTWVRRLFVKIYGRFDANYVDEFGFTHFHAACQSGCDDIVAKFLELGRLDPNRALPKTGNAPLHLALDNGRTKVVQLLLRAGGADPHLANAEGRTALHVLCNRYHEDRKLPRLFFEINDEKQLRVRVDARDNLDNTALHLAADKAGIEVIMLLLRRGASPNLANKDGSTPLHIVCKSGYDCPKWLEAFFKLSDVKHRPVRVNARDNLGNTPLHLIMRSPRESVNTMKTLLKNGADPNLANAEGSTPLHQICKNCYEVLKWMKLFFEVCEETNQLVRVDAKDNTGRTTLQWAVASHLPDVVDLLFDHGADVFSFVFPDESHFIERLKSHHSFGIELELASGVLIIVERLEKRGYELNRNDALMIVKLFGKYELFSKMALLDQCSRMVEFWGENEEREEYSKIVFIKPDLTLFDLIRLPYKEAAKLLTLSDCFEFARSQEVGNFCKVSYKDFFPYLCEIICRRFLRRWAQNFLWELTRYRLPILCCEMIIDDSFVNQDLCNICLAAEGQSHRDSEKKEQPDEMECDKKRSKRARKSLLRLRRI